MVHILLILLKLLKKVVVLIKWVPGPRRTGSTLDAATKHSILGPHLRQVLLSLIQELILCLLKQEKELLHAHVEDLLMYHSAASIVMNALLKDRARLAR